MSMIQNLEMRQIANFYGNDVTATVFYIKVDDTYRVVLTGQYKVLYLDNAQDAFETAYQMVKTK